MTLRNLIGLPEALLRKREQTESSFRHFRDVLYPTFKSSTDYVRDIIEIFPADVVDFAAFRPLFDAEVDNKPTAQQWTAAIATLPEAIEQFRAGVRDEVTALIPKKFSNIEGDVPLLDRVTTVFR